MMKKYKATDLIRDVFSKDPTPLSNEGIWKKAVSLGLNKKWDSRGKSPPAILATYLYMDVREKGEKSEFVQVSKRPALFTLRNSLPNVKLPKSGRAEEELTGKNPVTSSFDERDLHPVLVKYLKETPHFRCHTKTIFHEKSSKKTKGENQWLHPDLVGVYFPFEDFAKETMELLRVLSINSLRLFSFEVKKRLDFSNLRQCYFQAVSNSSWAHEGYLVCLEINSDPEFLNELQRLSNAFGIGVIRLDPVDLLDSEIVCPARHNNAIDWNTLDRLAEDSPDCKQFISDLLEDNHLSNVKSKYDKVLSDAELERYLKEKKIK